MFGRNDVRQILEEYIIRGCDKFIIYPFGDNGRMIKDLLKEYYNIEPIFVVDNKYSRYNPNIISFEELTKADCRESIVLLTIENDEFNFLMEEECLHFFKNENIVNMKRRIYSDTDIVIHKYLPKPYCRQAFASANFLEKVNSKDLPDKIKVRIFHHQPHTWNTCETICEEFKKDSRFELLIIVYKGSDFDQMTEQMRGYKYVTLDEYNSKGDLPDIFIYTGSFWTKTLTPIIKISTLSFLVPVVTMLYEQKKYGTLQTITELERASVDYCLAEKPLCSCLPKNTSVQVLEFGSPKFDGLYRCFCKRKNMPLKPQKLKDKYVILYATAHGQSTDGRFQEMITFDVYFQKLLNFIKGNEDIALIFRPHPIFIRELVKGNYWTADDVEELKRQMNDSENILWDEESTYENALLYTDAVITDGNCGMILSMLPFGIPICSLYRSHESESLYPELDDYLYMVRDKKELDDFLEQVILCRKDRLSEKRMMAWKRFIKNFDGQNGHRIKEFITEKYLNNRK